MMQKVYVERAKPAWRIFELADLQEIDAFKPEGVELLLEVKWDGERIQIQKHDGRVEIWSDYPRRVDHRLPHQVKELEALKVDNFRLDSEAVMLEPESKEALHRTMVTALLNGKFDPTERAKILHLMVFDCLEFRGKDLRDQPLTERIKFLKEFTGTDHIHLLTDYLSEDPGKDALAYIIPRSHKKFEAAIERLVEK
jgi:ATP-dependent DNA ligase